MKRSRFFSAKNVTTLGVLLALVVVLQVFGSYFKIGATPLSFVLVPIILGGILCGAWGGAFLGFAFGVIVVVQGLTGVDGFTMILLEEHPIYTTLLCLVKGTAAGVVAGLLYRWISKKSVYGGVFAAAIAAPIVNTGLFILGALAFLQDSLRANFIDGQTVVYFLIIVCAGINFLVELAINLVCVPALHSVIRVVKRGKR